MSFYGSQIPPPEYPMKLIAPPCYLDLNYFYEIVNGQVSHQGEEHENESSHAISAAEPPVVQA